MKLEIIWSEYQSSLKAFLYKNVSSQADVDDLLQEILIKTYQNLASIKDSKKIKPWLFQIANNTIIDFYRKRGRTNELSQDDLWFEKADEDVFQQLSSCVIPFIEGLDIEEAALLKAIEIDGVSQKEYAEQNDIKYSTLKSRVKKSRQNLYQLFTNCCEMSIDHQGNLMSFQAKNKNCSTCK